MPLLLVLALLLIGAPAAAPAAVLIEASAQGQPLRIVADRSANRALVERGGERVLVDHGGGMVYRYQGAGEPRATHARYRPGHDERLPPYRYEKFGPGPVYGGHVGTYNVLFVDETVCAEVLTSAWMAPFVDPAVRALALLDQLDGRLMDLAQPCVAVPISTAAAPGWPLLVGKIDQPTFETRRVRFDYQPVPGELLTPAEQAATK